MHFADLSGFLALIRILLGCVVFGRPRLLGLLPDLSIDASQTFVSNTVVLLKCKRFSKFYIWLRNIKI